MSAQRRDRTGDDGFGVFAQGDFFGEVACDAFVGFAPHVLQSFLDFRVRKQVQIRRLIKLNGKRLLERAIEDWVASGVDEFGENGGVFFSECPRVAR